MTKKEMVDLLVNEYGYDVSDLKDDKGNIFRNADLEALIDKEEKVIEEIEKKDKVGLEAEKSVEEEDDIFSLNEDAFKPKHTFNDNDLILCMSGVRGDMRFVSNLSNFTVKTTQFGQTVKIPYKDLVYVHNIAPQAFHDGKVIILNEHLQEEFGLEDVYKKVITPKNIRKVLELDADELSGFISDMPSGMKPALYDEARKLYRAGKLDSRRTVEVIENEFGVSLEDNAPLKASVGK